MLGMLANFCTPGRGLVYQVSFQLILAELRYGRVVNRFAARGSRRFPTAELNIILADLYEEVGPSATLLGLEIVQIVRLPHLRAQALT
jgi:hypothetical protein